MKIIIVGIGKVGSTLTEFLVNENHDIVIIDTNQKLLEEAINKYDVSGIVGSGASNDILIEAGAKKADMIIATTEFDELNILTCLFGKRNGIKYTVARVRNPEYSNQVKFFNKELDLDLIINPELEAANEISRILRFPSAENIELFAKSKVEIVGIRVKEDSQIVDHTLEELRHLLKTKFLICAVERNGKAHIPHGKFKLEVNDIAYITGAKNEILNLFKELGIYKNRAKSIMIIGGGVISYYLAKQLSETNAKVKIIEIDRDRAYELKELLPSVNIIHGDGSDKELLIEEGIKECDAFVTLTGLDEENIILSLYAQHTNTSKVVTKINKISYYDILSTLNLSSIISPKLITAYDILRYVRSLQNAIDSKVENMYKLINNQVEASEFLITGESEITASPLKDLTLRDNILIGVIIRGSKIIIPTGEDQIRPLDRVIVVTTEQNISEISELLS